MIDGIRQIQQTPDAETTFQMLAKAYISLHPTMSSGTDQCNHHVKDGMLAGSRWIPRNNSLNDVAFKHHRTFMVRECPSKLGINDEPCLNQEYLLRTCMMSFINLLFLMRLDLLTRCSA